MLISLAMFLIGAKGETGDNEDVEVDAPITAAPPELAVMVSEVEVVTAGVGP